MDYTPITKPHSESPRIHTLDGLRGCAVLLILIHHFVALGPLLEAPPGSFLSYTRAALGLTSTGVDLFFVISGFLIGGILLDHRQSPRLYRTFYTRRFLRIVPLAWLIIALVIITSHLQEGLFLSSVPWWAAFFFVTNIYLAAANGWLPSPLTPHWSLAIEEQFYVLFPLVVRNWPPTQMKWLGPTLILTAILSRLIVACFSDDNLFACHMLTICRLDSLGVGFCAAWLVRSKYWYYLSQRRGLFWASAFFLALGMVILSWCNIHAPSQMRIWGYTLVALFYGVVLLIAYAPNEAIIRSIFSLGILRLYGKFSYFIYLFQALLPLLAISFFFPGRSENEVLNNWMVPIFIIVVMLIPAALSWHLMEKRLLRLGRDFQYE